MNKVKWGGLLKMVLILCICALSFLSCEPDSESTFKCELPFEVKDNKELMALEEYMHPSKKWSMLLPMNWEIRENENLSAVNSMIAIDSTLYFTDEPDTLLIIPISVSEMEKTSHSLKESHDLALKGFKDDFPNLQTIDVGYGKMDFGKVTWHFYSIEDELGVYHGFQLMYKAVDSSIYILEIGFQGRFSKELLKEYFYILNTVEFKA